MRIVSLGLPLALVLSSCQVTDSSQSQQHQQAQQKQPVQPAQSPGPSSPAVDPLASRDPSVGQPVATGDIADPETRPLMQAQVVLDRLGFTPGVVDGKEGLSTRNAVSGFQEANSLTVTGKVDDPTRQALAKWNNILATRVVTIPADFAAGPFYAIPKGAAEQAKMPALGYESLDEKLAERFHTTIDTLKQLNPGGVPAGSKPDTSAKATPSATPPTASTPVANETASVGPNINSAADSPQPGPPSFFHAGQQIRVPNVGGDALDPAAVTDSGWRQTLATLGVGSQQPKAAKVIVSKSKGTLKAYDAAGKLVAVYTATMGSVHDPLPLGDWKILGIDKNPKFHYNPALFWDAKPGAEKAMLPAGPNGPVGVVWIAISKPHYGIHGTPRPETIGRAESHGCVRLTNWDAARLAQMVSTKTQLSFEA
jgi:lipoprotein-anchoring transpeptidase ErfK/SrfK